MGNWRLLPDGGQQMSGAPLTPSSCSHSPHCILCTLLQLSADGKCGRHCSECAIQRCGAAVGPRG